MEHPPPYSPNREYPPQQNPGSVPPPNPYPPQPQQGYPLQKEYGGPGYPPQNPGYVQQPAGFTSQTNNSTTVVVQQQQPQVVTGVIPIVNDQMGLSIFACLCCCWPIGICAIVKSSEARNRYAAGDYAGALASAQSARNLAYAAIICGVVIFFLSFVLRYAVFAASTSHN